MKQNIGLVFAFVVLTVMAVMIWRNINEQILESRRQGEQNNSVAVQSIVDRTELNTAELEIVKKKAEFMQDTIDEIRVDVKNVKEQLQLKVWENTPAQ